MDVIEFLWQQQREFPEAFRSLLDGQGKSRSSQVVPQRAKLKARCQCGACSFSMTACGDEGSAPRTVRCHCSACRRYHTSAFGAFVPIGRENLHGLDSKAVRYRDECKECGVVDRLFCGVCFSVLATVPQQGNYAGSTLVALGVIIDESIPRPLSRHWQHEFLEWSPECRAQWWTAIPASPGETDSDSSSSSRSRSPHRSTPARQLRGGCACGGCEFKADAGDGLQTQHCYCKLCRRLSGSVGQTWVPVRKESWHWTKKETLRLIRTTGHGQRHFCTRCGCDLAIVYDDQPDTTWPIAGSLFEDSLPEDMGGELRRAVHICCSMMQPWYRLPDDGLPRLKFAG